MQKDVKYAARTCYGKLQERGECETSFSELSARELTELAATDNYFTDEYAFDVLGASVGVTDCELGTV